MGDLKNRFEGAPPPPVRERVVSAVDAPTAVVGAEAREAQRRSAAKAHAAGGAGAVARRRRAPAIVAGDSDELRALKRAAQARELEVQAMAARLRKLAERLSRVAAAFDAVAHAPVVAAAPTGARDRVRSTEYGNATRATTARAAAPANRAPATSATSLEAILAAARTPRAGVAAPAPRNTAVPAPRTNGAQTAGTAPTSLEAILAAARGGTSASPRGSTGGTVKYSKLMREFK